MQIFITSDHSGIDKRHHLIDFITNLGYQVTDLGTEDTTSNYAELAIELGEAVVNHPGSLGIVMCGTGIGISIACNKVKKVRCAKVNNVREARLCRLDNDANIIALNEKMHLFEAKDIIDVFLNTKYQKEERFQRRIDKITKYEEKK